jgi:hypothetical protein
MTSALLWQSPRHGMPQQMMCNSERPLQPHQRSLRACKPAPFNAAYCLQRLTHIISLHLLLQGWSARSCASSRQALSARRLPSVAMLESRRQAQRATGGQEKLEVTDKGTCSFLQYHSAAAMSRCGLLCLWRLSCSRCLPYACELQC